MSFLASLESIFSEQVTFTSDHDTVACPRLPAELIDHVIDELSDDSTALCVMSLVCTGAMVRSREILFSILAFDKNDRRFDAFLNLLEHSRWTTFSAVKFIRITDLFRPRWHVYRIRGNVNHIAAHLPNLKSVWLSSTQVWQISWTSIPAHVRRLIANLDLHDLQIDSLLFHRKDWAELLTCVGKTVTMTLYNLEFSTTDDHAYLWTMLGRSLRFNSLDTSSVLPSAAAWDLSIANGLQITVNTLHLRPLQLPPWDRDYYLSFASQKFLRHAGPSIRSLFFHLSGMYFSPDALRCYDSLDLSQCTNLCVAHFGCISLCPERMIPMMAMMWTLLSTLPSPTRIEEVSITLGPEDEFKESRLDDFETFPWLEMVERLKQTLPNLKAIVIGVGTYKKTPSASTPYMEKMCNIELLKERGKAGLVRVNWIYWGTRWWGELPWRQLTGNE